MPNQNLIFGGRLFEEYRSARALAATYRHAYAFFSSDGFKELPGEVKSIFLPQGKPALDLLGAILSSAGLAKLVSGGALIAGSERLGFPAAISITAARVWGRGKQNKQALALANTFIGFKAREELQEATAAVQKTQNKNKQA